MEVENPMVIDSLWKHQEKEPEVIDECVGCLEDIYKGEEAYKFASITGQEVMVHQRADCCMQFIADISICEIAGEES
jgi:hypothetical protein